MTYHGRLLKNQISCFRLALLINMLSIGTLMMVMPLGANLVRISSQFLMASYFLSFW
ncbi:hypothetical protein P3TCK_12826 [Photobacterium profundum 3TCK]|uniref:Uncharacterized protein n=1 Tax=Photobacterium profundum 3TCK TaxID=314280 RepID=Q1Z5X2_9GAMM|nr:hypothetical protein P3TCK_12826 [Photobacterium profundum 3TCK]